MLANLYDAVQWNTYAIVASNSRRKPPKPDPIKRPQAARKTKEPGGSLFALKARQAYLAGQNAN